HAARNGKVHAMKEDVDQIVRKYPQASAYWCYSEPTQEESVESSNYKKGFVDGQWLRTILPTLDASFYFCGPVPFMKEINAALKTLNIPEADVHYEFFGPAGSLDKEPAAVV